MNNIKYQIIYTYYIINGKTSANIISIPICLKGSDNNDN